MGLGKFVRTESVEVSCGQICIKCDRQLLDLYDPPKGYSEEIKKECVKMYLNGMGFRAIERVKGVHHTSIIYWIKQLGEKLPDVPKEDIVPKVGELDELETFIGSKKQNLVVDSTKSF